MAAVGPNHIVEALNNVVVVFNKHTGQRLGIESRLDFFKTADGLHKGKGDPNILYDPNLGRWLAVALDSVSHDTFILAVSNGPDPIGSGIGDWVSPNWKKYAYTVEAGNDLDFPRLGVDGNGIYITLRRTSGSGYFNHIVAIPKTQAFRDGGAPFFQRMPIDLQTDVIVPPINFDPVSPTETALFVAQPWTESATKIQVGRVKWTTDTPPFAQWWGNQLVNLLEPGADVDEGVWQNGVQVFPLDPLSYQSSFKLAIHVRGFGSDYTMAMIRNGYLWTCHTIGVNSSGRYTGVHPSYGDADRTACEWLKFQIVPDGDLKTLQAADYGRMYEPTLARSYFMPSMGINARGDVIMGCSGSGPNEYIGAYFSGRLANAPPWPSTDLSHRLLGIRTLKAGLDNFSPNSTWGDYSYTCIDPSNPGVLWTVQEYAEQRHPVNGPNWGTWIGAISP
jgi:hypothetical protein